MLCNHPCIHNLKLWHTRIIGLDIASQAKTNYPWKAEVFRSTKIRLRYPRHSSSSSMQASP